MSTEQDRAYDVLGVKPGVSDRELKAAHRDMAKVWHPDRFVHDPRLQEKAQEKLKEINEAYEQLISRHKRRATPPPSPPPRRAQAPSEHVRVRRGIGWHWWIAVLFAVFALVFCFHGKDARARTRAALRRVSTARRTDRTVTHNDSTRRESFRFAVTTTILRRPPNLPLSLCQRTKLSLRFRQSPFRSIRKVVYSQHPRVPSKAA